MVLTLHYLYIISKFSGGYNWKSVRSTEIYNITDNSFVRKAPRLPVAVYKHCMVKWKSGNKVYIVGGVKSAGGRPTFQSRIQVLDIETRTFSTLSDQLRTGRATRGCAILDRDKKLVVTGFEIVRWRRTYSTEILDLNTNIWSAAATLPFREAYTPLSVDGSLYVMTRKGFFYHYNSDNDGWDLLSDKVPFDKGLSGKALAVDVNVVLLCKFL